MTSSSGACAIVALVLSLAGFLIVASGCERGQDDGDGNAVAHSRNGLSVLILAAASTSDAVTAAIDAFETKEKTLANVRISTGGSNALASQIMAGAPADLFLSANPKWADEVERSGHAAEVVPLLRNALVIAVPVGNPSDVHSPGDLVADHLKRIALAGENVPAGLYAENGLRAAGVYDKLVANDRIVRGADVRFALSYIERGEVDAGLVYATDARLTDRVEIVYTFSSNEVPDIVYPLVLLKPSAGEPSRAAREFFAFLQSPEAEGIFKAFGFDFADR